MKRRYDTLDNRVCRILTVTAVIVLGPLAVLPELHAFGMQGVRPTGHVLEGDLNQISNLDSYHGTKKTVMLSAAILDFLGLELVVVISSEDGLLVRPSNVVVISLEILFRFTEMKMG